MWALPFCHLRFSVQNPTSKRFQEDPKTWGERLKHVREERGIGQGELARRLGVHPDTLRRWEHHCARPGAKHQEKIVAFLGYEMEEDG